MSKFSDDAVPATEKAQSLGLNVIFLSIREPASNLLTELAGNDPKRCCFYSHSVSNLLFFMQLNLTAITLFSSIG